MSVYNIKGVRSILSSSFPKKISHSSLDFPLGKFIGQMADVMSA